VPERKRKYTDEFKKNTVELLQTSGKSLAEIATRLGIHPNVLYKWRRGSPSVVNTVHTITFTMLNKLRGSMRSIMPQEIVDKLDIQKYQMATCEIDESKPLTLKIRLIPTERGMYPEFLYQARREALRAETGPLKITLTRIDNSHRSIQSTMPLPIISELNIQKYQMATCEIDESKPLTLKIRLIPTERGMYTELLHQARREALRAETGPWKVTLTRIDNSHRSIQSTMPLPIISELNIQKYQMATCEIDESKPLTLKIRLIPTERGMYPELLQQARRKLPRAETGPWKVTVTRLNKLQRSMRSPIPQRIVDGLNIWPYQMATCEIDESKPRTFKIRLFPNEL